MNINYKESQIDFLSNPENRADEAARPRYMAARISLSLENLVILLIAAIMVVIFSFAMGNERGKRLALPASYPVAAGAVNVSAKEEPLTGASEVGVEKTEVVKAVPPVLASGVVPKTAVPVEVKAALVEAAPATALNSGYTLQVASYKNNPPAQREAEKLKQKGFRDVYVLPKGAYVIVCVGNFIRKEDASGVKRQLKNRYQDFVVRRL
ncbi:MAG: SPOR domain-containing protein [Candidatus Omnitrophota bacterium]